MCCDSGGSQPAPAPQETEFSKTLADIMSQQFDRSKVFRPLEDQLIGSVQQYQTPDFMAQQVGKSVATADQSADMAEKQRETNLMSMGVNPNSGAFANATLAGQLGKSLARTGAVNTTEDATRRLAYDTLAGAAGRGDAKVGQAIQAGSAGGNQLMQSQQNQIGWAENQQGQDSSAMSGIGSIVGLGLSFLSSKRYKKGVKPARGAMDEVRDMPVKTYRYRSLDEGGPTDDAREHVGPMAEDYAKATGRGDGNSIYLPDMVGTTMGAVQNLDSRVRRLEKQQ